MKITQVEWAPVGKAVVTVAGPIGQAIGIDDIMDNIPEIYPDRRQILALLWTESEKRTAHGVYGQHVRCRLRRAFTHASTGVTRTLTAPC